MLLVPVAWAGCCSLGDSSVLNGCAVFAHIHALALAHASEGGKCKGRVPSPDCNGGRSGAEVCTSELGWQSAEDEDAPYARQEQSCLERFGFHASSARSEQKKLLYMGTTHALDKQVVMEMTRLCKAWKTMEPFFTLRTADDEMS